MTARYAAPLGAFLLALLLSVPASAATCTWNGGAAAWQTPSAWSCNAVPGPTDDVVIAAGTVTFSAGVGGTGSVTVRSFTMTGGTLDGDGTVTVSESLVWETGTMAGEGSTIVLGTAEFTGATSKTIRRTLYLRGASTWSNGTLQFGDDGVLVNEGTFIDNSAGSHSIARAGSTTGDPYVLNRGTWSVESVGTNGNVHFFNDGTLRVDGAGFRVISPARFENNASGTIIGAKLLDLASGPTASFGGRTQPFGAGTVGVFPIEGPVPMSDTHVLDIDLAGPDSFDQIASSRGSVSIDGQLLVRVGSEAVAGATYPILTHATTYPMTGCYGPEDVVVTEPDGVTPAPYNVAVACSATGVQITVTEMNTAGEGDPTGRGGRLDVTGANPFAGRTALAFTASVSERVLVEAFDVTGRRVAVLFEGVAAAGQPVPVAFDGAGLPAGLYVVRVTGEGLALTRTVTLAR
ncbi:hypothetical protein [Rubrivirga marina]|uniref:Secretion system C-terminal sorting domain-containing protein n=1 Tax=Rubrivirga marina TaxID=1196024 RepID=A0A271IZQ7_9BACT|nr:hypothetical protein [Rubrivirga marina]PAP75979.1 hypothetical protein BSZ37_05750 [Rubrivirga marina]